MFIKFLCRRRKQWLPLFPRSQQQIETQFHQGSLRNQWVYLTYVEQISEGLLTGVGALHCQHLKSFTQQEWKFLCSCVDGAPLQCSLVSIYYSPTPRPPEELPSGREQLENLVSYSDPLWVWGGEWRDKPSTSTAGIIFWKCNWTP